MKHSLIEPLEARIAPAAFSISVQPAASNEGAAGNSHLVTFTVTLDSIPASPVSVQYHTLDGQAVSAFDNATEGEDYVGTSGILTFDANSGTQKTFTVTINGDDVFEHDERFGAMLTDATGGATINPNATKIFTSITNDDPAPVISIEGASVVEGNDPNNPNQLVFTVKLSKPTFEDVTVTATTADGTATTQDNDYTAKTMQITFAPGEVEKTFIVPITGDTKVEADETVLVKLSQNSANSTLDLVKKDAAGTIISDELNLTIGDATKPEGNPGDTPIMDFVVKLGGATPGQVVTFDYATVEGTAVSTGSNPDYQSTSGTMITLTADADGNASYTIHVPIIGDSLAENDETFTVNLSNVTSGVTAVKSSATGTIIGDDPILTISPATVTEGNLNTSQDMAFVVTIDHALPNSDIKVLYHTVDGSAVSTGTVVAGTLDFEAAAVGKFITLHTDAQGHVSNSINVKVFGDGVTENNESFNVIVDSATVVSSGEVIPIQTNTLKGTINDNDTTVVTIGDFTIVEGDSGQKQAVFLVTLTPASQGSVVVNYTTGVPSDTAKAGQDFTTTNGSITFAPGQTSKTIVVPILDDLVYEGTETFSVKLTTSNSGISFAKDTGTGTIVDNEAVPTISLAPATVNEGDAGGTAQLSFVATLSSKSSKPVTVRVATADGTAIAGSDYTALSSPDPDHPGEFLPYKDITFAPGETTKAILVNVTGDTENEADETLSVQLSNPDGATLSPTSSTAIGTIRNDEITVSFDPIPSFSEGAPAGTAFMTVKLSNPPIAGSSVTVNFVLNGGTAKLNDDIKLHDPAITSLTFEAGETTKTIALDIVDDTISEGRETFNITLTSATGGIIPVGTKIGSGTIDDNGDALPTVTIQNAQPVTEGDSGTKNMTFTVKLTEAAGQPVKIRVATVDGTAVAGSDYTALTSPDPLHPSVPFAYQEITFAAGETEKTVTVKILSDTIDETSESFKVVLSEPTPIVTIGDAEAVGTIVDNDLLALSIADASAPEGNGNGEINHMLFTVSIPKASLLPITVNYDLIAGTAKAGIDYVEPANRTVTFMPGQTTATIDIEIIGGNTTVGPAKTFVVSLLDPENATIADKTAIGTITDDESTYKLVVVSDSSIEDDPNTAAIKTVTYKVIRSGDTTLPGTVSFTTVNGSADDGNDLDGMARAGFDFVGQTGTLNFAAGDTEETITISLLKDSAHEGTETFALKLTGSTGGVLRDAADAVQSSLTATATILDNDDAPKISIASISKAEGNPGTPNDPTTTDFKFTVSLSAADELNDVTVMYQTEDGTGPKGAISTADGTRPADFMAIGPTLLTIPKGSLSADFVVHVVRDTVMEGDEKFTVKLSNPLGHGETFAAGGDTATGTITNDDGQPTITFESSSVTVVEGDSGQTPATFTVKLSKASEVPVTVTVGVVTAAVGTSGTATLGTDFLDNGVTTLTFAPGETSQTLSYAVLGDSVHETNETFTVKLSNAQEGSFSSGTTIQATATIKNEDPTPALFVQNVTVVEGNDGETTNLVFEVTLAGETELAVTVDYTTLDIGAFSSGAAPDFQAVSGTLTFAAGEHSKTISVPIIGDDFKEGPETFSLQLSNATEASIAQSLAFGTIEDGGDTTIGVTVTDVQTVEGDNGTKNATFSVSLSGTSDVPVTVQVATRNGTAVAGADYTAKTTTLTFAAGEKTKTFDVALRSDTVFEATESFFVEVKNPTNAVILDGEGRATIYNDDLQIVNAKTVRYVDADGDIATVHVSKGKLTTTGQSPVLNFSAVNNIGGRTLEMIDFTRNRFVFNHTDLSVTADLQPGFNASGGTSDGRVDVGYIQGGIAQGSVFQIFDNIDFGHVLVEGDLGKIVAGDQIATDRAIQSLTILSHGVKGTTTGAPDNVSIFLGGARRIAVGGDWNGALESVGGDTGDIESLKIKGALRGDSNAGTGQVFFTGTLRNAVIGSIVGGTGDFTGTIFGNFTNDATLNSGSSISRVHVLGDIVGGAGDNSGRIFAPNIGGVVVDGSLKGGSGGTSGVIQSGVASVGGSLGKVIIGGDVVGGAGAESANSGEIFASKTLGTVVVHGSLIGGENADSGTIVSLGGANTVKVLKDIVGGAGERSGTVQITKSLANFQLGTSEGTTDGNLKGGKGASSGLLSIGRDLKVGVIHGNIVGGTGASSGGVSANGRLAKLAIGKDIIGGSTDLIDVSTISTSGYISADRIGVLNIAGDIRSGTKADTNQTIIASGTIRVFGDIDSLTVNNIVGNSEVPVVIAAAGAATGSKNQTIGALTVKGDVAFANILGGYSGGVSATNLLGNPLNPDAQMGTIKILGSVEATNIVAGIDAGDDGRFGTSDDEVITGGSTDNPALRSRIAAVIIGGEVKPNTDPFGVVAQIIAAATIGTTRLDLNPNGLDEQVPLGPTGSKFFLHEVGLA
jgi:hypothetical protein